MGKELAEFGCLKLNAKGLKWLWKTVILTLVIMLIKTVTIPRTPVSNVVDVSVTMESHPRNNVFITCTRTCIILRVARKFQNRRNILRIVGAVSRTTELMISLFVSIECIFGILTHS